MAREAFGETAVAGWVAAVSVVFALAGAAFGRTGRRGLATALIATGGALGLLAVWAGADGYGWPGTVLLVDVVTVVAACLLLLGWFTPLGRAGVVGSVHLVLLAVAWEVVIAMQDGAAGDERQARAGAVMAVVSVVALGVLPRLALAASGLAGLDDRRASGVSVSRYGVATALTAAHRGLALATVALAVSAGAGGVLALREPTVWTLPLAVLTCGVVVLRARAFPLVAEVVALLAAGAVLALGLVWVWLEADRGAYGPLAVAAGFAVVPLLVLAVEPAEHVRVRLRRIGDLAETVGVIALIPLAIGVFGVYGRLLGTFA